MSLSGKIELPEVELSPHQAKLLNIAQILFAVRAKLRPYEILDSWSGLQTPQEVLRMVANDVWGSAIDVRFRLVDGDDDDDDDDGGDGEQEDMEDEEATEQPPDGANPGTQDQQPSTPTEAKHKKIGPGLASLMSPAPEPPAEQPPVPTTDRAGHPIQVGDIVEDVGNAVFGVVTHVDRGAVVFQPLGYDATEHSEAMLTQQAKQLTFCYRPFGRGVVRASIGGDPDPLLGKHLTPRIRRLLALSCAASDLASDVAEIGNACAYNRDENGERPDKEDEFAENITRLDNAALGLWELASNMIGNDQDWPKGLAAPRRRRIASHTWRSDQ